MRDEQPRLPIKLVLHRVYRLTETAERPALLCLLLEGVDGPVELRARVENPGGRKRPIDTQVQFDRSGLAFAEIEFGIHGVPGLYGIELESSGRLLGSVDVKLS